MKPSQTALSKRIQQFISKLHPPAPPTARETSKLLGILGSSFQKELDAAHPKPGTLRDNHQRTNAVTSQRSEIPLPGEQNSLFAMQEHWDRLSRLIDARTLQSEITSATPAIVTRLENVLAQVEATQSLGSLGHLLSIYNQDARILKVPSSSREDARKTARLFFDRLNIWLLDTTPHLRKEFFQQHFLLSATNLLVLSHQEGILWQWLSMVYERRLIDAPVFSIRWLRVEDILVCSLMQYAMAGGDLLEAAQQFVHASQYQIEANRPVTDPRFGNMSSWRLTAAILSRKLAHGLDQSTYDQVLHHLSSKGDAHLCKVYHPTRPNSKDLVTYLRKHEHATVFLKRHVSTSQKASSRNTAIFALLDAAELSLTQDRPGDAKFLLEFVTQSCLRDSSSTDPAKVSLSQIDLLRKSITSRLPQLSSNYVQSAIAPAG